ncbi:MAG TPA: YbaK/EbsC family protein [Vicinamibacteria bacterium]|nr:YbaK/EbsC family protein [Vicinamibacteria bacterium]
MKLPAHGFLDEHEIRHEVKTFPATTEKGAANVARALGFRERQMVKTLLFESGKGERVLVMVGGDRTALSGHLKKAIGDRNIKMARPEIVREVTGYDVGSVPPFHWQPPGFRSFLDRELTEEAVLGVGAGVWGNEILITPENLVRACHAIVVNLTDPDNPVR